MTASDISSGHGLAQVHRVGVAVLVAALWVGPIAPAFTAAAPPAGAPTEAGLIAWAMHWFTEMQAGRTDRSQYAPAYRAQITDDAVKEMSHALDKYGASPLRAEIVQTRKSGDQTFYMVKFVAATRPACCSASMRRARSPASVSGVWRGIELRRDHASAGRQ